MFKKTGHFITCDSRMRFNASEEIFHMYVNDHGDLLRGFVWIDEFFGFADCTEIMKRDVKFLASLKEYWLTRNDEGFDPMDLARDYAIENGPGDVA